MPIRSDAEFDRGMYRMLADSVATLTQHGLSEDEAATEVGGAFGTVLVDFSSRVASSLHQTRRSMLDDHTAQREEFLRSLTATWGEALDQHYALLVGAREFGENFTRRHRRAAVGAQDRVFEALVQLYAKACRTMHEVNWLMSGGFAQGALARARTLHEISVMMAVIGENGRSPEHADLAERYILHRHMFRRDDAAGPAKTSLLARFGRPYKEQYGWAAGLMPGRACKFKSLEELAGLQDFRDYYEWASHEVHPDSEGLALNRTHGPLATYLTTGPTDDRLAEPGQLSANSLLQCSVALAVHGVPDVSPGDLLVVATIGRLAADLLGVLADVASQVDRRNARDDRRWTARRVGASLRYRRAKGAGVVTTQVRSGSARARDRLPARQRASFEPSPSSPADPGGAVARS